MVSGPAFVDLKPLNDVGCGYDTLAFGGLDHNPGDYVDYGHVHHSNPRGSCHLVVPGDGSDPLMIVLMEDFCAWGLQPDISLKSLLRPWSVKSYNVP
jgi:hypothetical protein